MSEEEEELVWDDEEYVFLELEDGKLVIDEEYITESRPLRRFYRYGFRGIIPAPIQGKSSRIIRKALEFCKERGEIKKKHWKHQTILQQKLKLFDDNFFQHNNTDAFDLADVACRLQIRSLYYLMRKHAADMLAQKTPDNIRKILKIHYDEKKTTDRDFKWMKRVVGNAGWAFRSIM